MGISRSQSIYLSRVQVGFEGIRLAGFGALIFFGHTVEPPASPEKKTQALASSWAGIPFLLQKGDKGHEPSAGRGWELFFSGASTEWWNGGVATSV